MSALTDIKGIGPVLAKACADKGYRTIKKIATAVVAELATVPGISEARAKVLVAAAKSLLADVPAPKVAVAAKADSGVKNKRAKKPTPKKKSAKAEISKKDKKAKKAKKSGKNKKKKSVGKGSKGSGKKK